MILAHKIQLKPTCSQVRYFIKACGTSRFVWNWALEEWNRQYKAGEKPNGMKLKKEFNQIKYQQFSWLRGVHRDAHARPFTNLQSAFVRFFKHLAKHPKFKKKGTRDSFYVANDKIIVSDNTVRLPLIGWIKMIEALRFTGRIMNATVSRTTDRWFISILVDVGDYSKQRYSDDIVGVDLGLKCAVTLSSGEVLDAPKPLKQKLKQLRRLSKAHSRKQKGSNNRKKAQLRLSKLYWRIACQRQDFLHEATTHICRENQTVVIEDLGVKNMMKNRRLARAISDIGWYEFRRQLVYKSLIYGMDLVVAPRFYPSSKTCSNCGHVKAKLSLSERTFTCSKCGFTLDRDLNAARNLCTLGLRGIDACGHYVRPASTEAAMVEAGTRPCSFASAN